MRSKKSTENTEANCTIVIRLLMRSKKPTKNIEANCTIVVKTDVDEEETDEDITEARMKQRRGCKRM